MGLHGMAWHLTSALYAVPLWVVNKRRAPWCPTLTLSIRTLLHETRVKLSLTYAPVAPKIAPLHVTWRVSFGAINPYTLLGQWEG